MAVVIETTLGDITVDLFLQQRPVTCLNFLKLCKMKYYNFNLFHTIRSGFIAQTGDPTGEGSGGESIFGLLEGPSKRFFSGEKMPKIRHTDIGLLSMVCTEDMMVGSQFFFTLGSDLDSLDGVHCVIGEVTEGHDILRKLNEVICDETHRPYQDVRITHTVILEDPFNDPAGFRAPSRSPSPTPERLKGGRIAPDEELDEIKGKSAEEIQEMIEEKEAKARATILEIIGDLPDADIAPPENVLFVCKLNPVTTDEDLEIIFSRFGKIVSCEVIRDKKTGDSLQYAFIEFADKKSCEDAYFKMDNVLIDDRRIHVDFSQSVSKIKWLGKGRGVKHINEENNHNENQSHMNKKQREDKNYNYRETERQDNRHREIEKERETGRRNRENHNHREIERQDDRVKHSETNRKNRENRNKEENRRVMDRQHDRNKDINKEKEADRRNREESYSKNKREEEWSTSRHKHRSSGNHSYKRADRNDSRDYKLSIKDRHRSRSKSKEYTKNARREDSQSNRHHNSRKEVKAGSSQVNKVDDPPKYFNKLKSKSSSKYSSSKDDYNKDSSKELDHKKRNSHKDHTKEIDKKKNSKVEHQQETYKNKKNKTSKEKGNAKSSTPPVKKKNIKSKSKINKKHSKPLKKKRKHSTSTSTSDSESSVSSSSTSDSTSSSDSEPKRNKRKRKSSSSSSSSSSTSASSTSASSTTSTNSDSEPKRKKKKVNEKTGKKFKKK